MLAVEGIVLVVVLQELVLVAAVLVHVYFVPAKLPEAVPQEEHVAAAPATFL